MKKMMLKAPGLGILVVIVTILALCPSIAYATRTTGTYLSGFVTVGGQPTAKGSVVTAWIENCDNDWQTEVYFSGSDSIYALVVPADSGTGPKNGGVNGDIIHFSLTVNGRTLDDKTTALWQQSEDVRHAINVIIPPYPTLEITTSSLEDGMVNSGYSATIAATGGLMPYSWSANNLPDGLEISSEGIISGIPTTAGTNISVTIICSDTNPSSQTDSVPLTINIYPELMIGTAKLTWSAVEDKQPNLPVYPGWIKGIPYTSTLTATGGNGTYIWSASAELAASGLSMNNSGIISGTPNLEGEYNITFTVTDSANPPKSASRVLGLKIYLKGDANGKDGVTITDVTYVERVILNLSPATAGCDASLNGEITVADVTKIERIILRLDPPDV
jgi:hypothetical protein